MAIKIHIKYLFILNIFLCLCFVSYAKQFHITTNGTMNGNGTTSLPWDLPTALNHPSIVSAGDTLWLHAGIYQGNFISNLNGSKDHYIYLIQFKGERATIEDNRQYASGATLQINGAWTIYKDFEVRNSNANRNSNGANSFRPMGLQIQGAHTKCINLVIHDVGHGIGFWKEAIDSEIYGCIIYNCGTFNQVGQYSTHGHGIYSQNNSGIKTIKNNIVFNQFGFGLHIYPNPGNISGYLIEGNTLYNNGILTHDSIRYSNVLINHYSPYTLENIRILNNYTYDSKKSYTYKALIEADLYLGSASVNAKKLEIQNNYLMGQGRAGMAILNWDSINYQGNTCFYLKNGSLGLALPSGATNKAYTWNNNQYFIGDQPLQFSYQYGSSINFSSWKTLTGFDSNSNVYSSEPQENKIIVQPNEYQQGRANIIIYNWENLGSVSLDLSNCGLQEGQTYKILDASNFYTTPLSSGIYNSNNSKVSISLNGLMTEAPIGMNNVSHTAPYFVTLVLMPGESPNSNLIKQSINNSIKIYPNPTNNLINFNYYASNEYPIRCVIYDAMGKVVIEQELETNSIGWVNSAVSVKELNEGVYFIKLRINNNEIFKKFIVLKN